MSILNDMNDMLSGRYRTEIYSEDEVYRIQSSMRLLTFFGVLATAIFFLIGIVYPVMEFAAMMAMLFSIFGFQGLMAAVTIQHLLKLRRRRQ